MPKQSTALLIIHGIGQQHPFETLDAFATSLWNVLEQNAATGFLPGHHRTAAREGWMQNYVSIETSRTSSVDVYEYYWAHKAQCRVKLNDIVEWLIDTSDGARKFYDENEELSKKYEGTGVSAFGKSGFKNRWYLKQFGWLMRLLAFLPRTVVLALTRWFGPLLFLFNPIFKWIRKTLVDFIGDIVIYTSTDIKSQFYEVRKQILDGAVKELESLLLDKRYKRIIVAGHSLGSVIGFDTLNRINQGMNVGRISPNLAQKIKGFVTFGSPLDKIAFFFREHTPDDQYLRRQILMHYHSFKAKPLSEQPNPKEVSNPFKEYLDDAYWINFWDTEDKVSGQLDFYRVNENVRLEMKKGVAKAHSAYWECAPLYERIKRWLT